MRLLLLANPEASAYKPVKLNAAKRQLAVAHDVTMARTEERDHATARRTGRAVSARSAVAVSLPSHRRKRL